MSHRLTKTRLSVCQSRSTRRSLRKYFTLNDTDFGRIASGSGLPVAYGAGYGMLELASPSMSGNQLEQVVRLTRTLPTDAQVHLVEVARLLGQCDMDLDST